VQHEGASFASPLTVITKSKRMSAMVNPSTKLHMLLSESQFPFSRRMLSFFKMVEVSSIAELAAIPLQKITCFRGFKTKCTHEIIAFIEFEGIQELFEGYLCWKEKHNLTDISSKPN
jgi:hypothetical protein